jgi:hypothetical protein
VEKTLLAHGIDGTQSRFLEQRTSDLRFAMKELGAELDGDLQAGHAPRPAAPPDAFARLQDQRVETFAREFVGRREAGGTRADHDDIRGLRRGSQVDEPAGPERAGDDNG